ncbi:MAG: peptidase dimerization domain-containing protein [Bacteroides sp.]|nr:peptidase dimerization domain-containing protein [Bacteroides sp.]MDD3037790.1 peptidase dimerization domain-containing protein [Bacteroides sp.]
MEKFSASNVLVRTTKAVTMAKGSDALNVLTSEAEVRVNFRILSGDLIAGVMEHVKKICEGYDVSIDVISQREPSGISPENVRGFQIIKEELAEIYPVTIITSYITIGGTDSYKYQIVSHNENEYISLENFGKIQWYFKEVMRNY